MTGLVCSLMCHSRQLFSAVSGCNDLSVIVQVLSPASVAESSDYDIGGKQQGGQTQAAINVQGYGYRINDNPVKPVLQILLGDQVGRDYTGPGGK